MSLNLHSVVRGAIQAVNADISAVYYKSSGYGIGADGKQTPIYEPWLTVQIQSQPPSGRDQQFINYLQLQGVVRTVFLYHDPQAIVRVAARGGDLLRFARFHTESVDTWLVAHVAETWDVSRDGWTKLYAVLQTDGSALPNTSAS